jgi:hypothetical protein
VENSGDCASRHVKLIGNFGIRHAKQMAFND